MVSAETNYAYSHSSWPAIDQTMGDVSIALTHDTEWPNFVVVLANNGQNRTYYLFQMIFEGWKERGSIVTCDFEVSTLV